MQQEHRVGDSADGADNLMQLSFRFRKEEDRCRDGHRADCAQAGKPVEVIGDQPHVSRCAALGKSLQVEGLLGKKHQNTHEDRQAGGTEKAGL